LRAVKEVENLLSDAHHLGRQYKLKVNELELAQKSVNLAQRRYMNGALPYLDVLQILNTLNVLEREILNLKITRLQNRVALYRELAGSWENEELDSL
jgi:outer membrane protein TolC